MDAPDFGYDLATFASDLVAAVEGLHLRRGSGRPILAGHSLGAMVILEALEKAPGLAGGAVLVEGGLVDASVQFASLDECLARLKLTPVGGMLRARVEGYLRATYPGWSDERLVGTMAAFEVQPDGTVRWRLTAPRFESLIRSMWAQHASEAWPLVTVAMLVVAADTGDEAWTEQKRSAAAAAERTLPRARVRWLTGDHDIHASRPAEVAELMLQGVADGFLGSGATS